ncbi:MAG: hypothetical protein GF398_08135, partial [Chitinivibrionales bacterium]|nr:hypothetical protein [Chitinivibrionales bacterium]
MHIIYRIFVSALLAAVVSLDGGRLIGENSSPQLDWAGTKALREGEYEQALAEVLRDTVDVDTLFRFFKLGLIHSRLEDDDKALLYLRLAAKDSLLSPFAYELIGDVSARQGQPANAIHAYRVALDAPIPLRFQQRLNNKMFAALKQDSTVAAQISWFQQAAASPEITDETWVPELFDTLLRQRRWSTADSILGLYLADAGADGYCKICTRFLDRPVPDSLLSTSTLYLLSRMMSRCNKLDQSSDWLHMALDRADFAAVVDQKDYLRHRAHLNYLLGNYKKAVAWFKKYHAAYGLTPGNVLTLARTWRKLGRRSKAAYWYDKHISAFPHHSKTHDIIWYRAWQREDAGNYAQANVYFKKLFTRYRRGAKAGPSYIRFGLNQYKMGRYDSAAVTFAHFERKYATSSYVNCARFWLAKSLIAQKKLTAAKAKLREICTLDPADYYAHRARERLSILGEEPPVVFYDSTFTIAHTRSWMDSVSGGSRKELSSADSQAYRLGTILAVCGLVEHAEYYLRHLETDFPQNLMMQFDLAALYKICIEPTLSYRVARRLDWRIAEKYRGVLPL